MNQMVLPVASSKIARKDYHVAINIQVNVLNPEVVRRKANVWMGMNIGNLLAAENPELVLGERLSWRFDVVLTTPNLADPGTAVRRYVAKIQLDANSGDVINPGALEAELRENAAATTSISA